MPLTFHGIHNGELVGQTIQLTLTGTVPGGEYLWIFVYSQGDYYVEGTPAPMPSNYWFLPGVTLGTNSADDINAPYAIYAVLANRQANAAIKEDLKITGGNTGTPTIPGGGGAQTVANLTVLRNH
jgi:hypothetical protein